MSPGTGLAFDTGCQKAPADLGQLNVALRKAARALGRAKLNHAFGHCSVRLGRTTFLVCKSVSPSILKPGEDGTVVSVSGPLPETVLGEVRVHQAIYARRPEINAVCRILPPQLMALSSLGLTPKIRHGFSAYFHPGVPLFDDPALMRSDEVAQAVANQMADAPAILLRGNGCVIAGESLARAVALAWFLEDSARVEFAALSTGLAERGPQLTADEARARAVWTGGVAERMWAYLTDGDLESFS
jgi:HCOMODA/2-hydroxy-3-carboxy-muconic semialdehyde decarboxylase